MLDLDPNRPATSPRPAASLLLLREGAAGGSPVEVLCLVRGSTRFLSGAVAFPGGRVDAADTAPPEAFASAPDPRGAALASDDAPLGALLVAAARECVEETGVLPGLADAALTAAVRADLARELPLATALASRGLGLDAARLVPAARWVTPRAEARRYDARFFAVALGQDAIVHADSPEATSIFWESPARVLSRFFAGELQLAPPTYVLLAGLDGARDVADALARVATWPLEPVCPELVTSEGGDVALALPGDPAHPAPGPTVLPGATRFVLREGRFVPGLAP